MNNLEWRNRNSLRNYPLRENATRLSTDGHILPNGFLVDMSCFFTQGQFYLSQIEIGTDLTITIRFTRQNQDTPIAKVVIPFLDQVAFSSHRVTGSGLAITGRLVIGEAIIDVLAMGAGKHNYTFEAAALESSVVLPVDFGIVTSVGILGREEFLVGDVKLKLQRAITGGAVLANNSIDINAIKRAEDCKEVDPTPIIKRINGLTPDKFGNISITAEDLLILRAGTAAGEGGPATPGLIVETILNQTELCPRPFVVSARGADGGAGPAGPPGPPGLNTLCIGDICCPCTDPSGSSGGDQTGSGGDQTGDGTPVCADFVIDSFDTNDAGWHVDSAFGVVLGILSPAKQGTGALECLAEFDSPLSESICDIVVDLAHGGPLPGFGHGAPWDFSKYSKLCMHITGETDSFVASVTVFITMIDDGGGFFGASHVGPVTLVPVGFIPTPAEFLPIEFDISSPPGGFSLDAVVSFEISYAVTSSGSDLKVWFDGLEGLKI